LSTQSANHWTKKLQKSGIWAVEVLDWLQMKKEPAYQMLTMEQKVG
jgi:hypothetical protein